MKYGSLTELINKLTLIEERGIVTFTNVKLIQVILENVKKAKEAKMREEEIAAKSRNIQVTRLQRQSSGAIFAELVRRQKIEEHAASDLDLRDDENRRSLTSSAVAEEGQGVSSKSTIDERWLTQSLEVTTSVSSHPIYRKRCRNIG